MVYDKIETLKELVDTNKSHGCFDSDFNKITISAYVEDTGGDVKFYSNVGKSYDIHGLILNIFIGYDSFGHKKVI